MSTIQWYISALGGPLQLLGFAPYALAILRGETKPKKATWLIWGAVDAVLISGMYAANLLNAQMVAAMVGVFAIVYLAFKYGEAGWTLVDAICLIGAALGILLWISFDNPVLAVITSCTVLWIGAIPTFGNAWLYPEKEDRVAWTIFASAGLCTVIGIPALTFAEIVQPLTFFLIDAIILALVLLRSR